MAKEFKKTWGVNITLAEWLEMEATIKWLGFGYRGGRTAFVRTCANVCRTKAFEELIRSHHKGDVEV